MSDLQDIATRSAVGSDVIRKYPGAHIQIFTSGTATSVWEGVADQDGHWSVPTLATGKYDIKVDGVLVKTINHVTATHVHSADQTWMMFRAGAMNASHDEDSTCPVFCTPVAGAIISVMAVVEKIAYGDDLTVHLLKAAANGAAALTVVSNSVWNRRFQNITGSTIYRDALADSNPGIALAANDSVTMGIIQTDGAAEGVTLVVVFRPTS